LEYTTRVFTGQIKNGSQRVQKSDQRSHRSSRSSFGIEQNPKRSAVRSVWRRTEKSSTGRPARERSADSVLRRDNYGTGQLFRRARHKHIETGGPQRENCHMYHPSTRVRSVRSISRSYTFDQWTFGLSRISGLGERRFEKVLP